MRAWMRYFEEVPTTAIRVPPFNTLFSKAIKGKRSAGEFEEMTARMRCASISTATWARTASPTRCWRNRSTGCVSA